MKLVKSAVLVSVLFPVVVMAQAPTSAPAPVSTKTITPYGSFVGSLRLVDSETKTVPSTKLERVRFGLNASDGIFSAGLETQLTGEKATKTDNTEVISNNNITIRKATIGLSLPAGTVLSLGRVRPGGANSYVTVNGAWLDGFGATDGLMLVNTQTFDGGKINARLALGNTLSYSNITLHTGASQKLNTVIAGADANFNGIEFAAMYGTVTKGIKDNTANIGDKLTTYTANDFNALELSLGYTSPLYTGGVWYSRVYSGQNQTAMQVTTKYKDTKGIEQTKTEKGNWEYSKIGDATADVSSTVKTLIGFGGGVSSRLFYTDNLLSKGDYIMPKFYVAMKKTVTSYNNSVTDNDKATKKTAETDKDPTQIGFELAYITPNKYELHFEFIQEQTKGETSFTDKSGTGVKSKNRLDLIAVYNF